MLAGYKDDDSSERGNAAQPASDYFRALAQVCPVSGAKEFWEPCPTIRIFLLTFLICALFIRLSNFDHIIIAIWS
jgi:hypothetical protein